MSAVPLFANGLRGGHVLALMLGFFGVIFAVNGVFIAALRARASPVTVLTQLRHLSLALAVMEPGADRSLLNLGISRLPPLARSVRDKASRLVTPVALLQLGQRLMADRR